MKTPILKNSLIKDKNKDSERPRLNLIIDGEPDQNWKVDPSFPSILMMMRVSYRKLVVKLDLKLWAKFEKKIVSYGRIVPGGNLCIIFSASV
jgi:hypothetical protein